MILSQIPPWAAVVSLGLAVAGGVATVVEQLPGGRDDRAPAAARTGDGPPPPSPTPRTLVPIQESYAREALRAALIDAAAIPDAPERTEALLRLGRAQMGQGEQVQAIATFRRALDAMATGKPEDNWTIPHPVVRIAEAQANNGEKQAAHRTFLRAIDVIAALPEGRRGGDYLNAIRIQQAAEGRAASIGLVAVYRQARLDQMRRTGREMTVTDLARLTANAGDFAGAIELIRRSPDRPEGAQQGDDRASATIGVAGALLPDDPPDLIDPILDDARRSLLAMPNSFWKFQNAVNLVETRARLGRFDHPEDLDLGFTGEVADVLREDNIFKRAKALVDVARARMRLGQLAAARLAAREALDQILQLDKPGLQIYPIGEALPALISAGGFAEAARVFEALPANLPRWQFAEPFVAHLLEQGRTEKARRMVAEAVAQMDTAPDGLWIESWQVRQRTQVRAELQLMVATTNEVRQMVAAVDIAHRPEAWPDLVRELTRRRMTLDALVLADQAGDPALRCKLRMIIAESLPPPRPPLVSP